MQPDPFPERPLPERPFPERPSGPVSPGCMLSPSPRDARRLAWRPVVTCLTGAFVGLEHVRHPGAQAGNDSPLFGADRPSRAAAQRDARQLAAAMAQAAGWPDGLAFVELAPHWFAGPGLVAAVAEMLERSGLDPARLQLAIGEATIELARDAVAFDLERLRGLGVGLVLDGFGAGQASLTTLRTMEFDRVRLAPDMVRRLGSCRRTEAAVRSVLQLGPALGLRVCAAGVEKEEQLAILQAYRCEEVQGPLIGAASADAAAPGTDELSDLRGRLDDSHLFFAVTAGAAAGAGPEHRA